MKTKLAALCLIALSLPAPAQDNADEEYWDDDAGVEERDQAQVDVSVDMGTPGASVSFSTFHDELAPYGEWVTVGAYGRVWRPLHVAAGWRPYYYGRWEWTDEGWLWVSDEPWGWAAYHYGRWAYDPSYAWVWVPGYQWAPAWVTWRYGPEYIGWAPLGPGFSVYVTSYPVLYNWWTFVPCQRFVAVPVHTVAFSGAHVRGIWHGTQPAPPRAIAYGGARAPAWGGPARPFVETRIGRPITPVRVHPVASASAVSAAPARRGFVPIYRPEVRPSPARSGFAPAAPAPARSWSPGAPHRPAAPSQGGSGTARATPVPGGGWRGPTGVQAPSRPAPPTHFAPAPRVGGSDPSPRRPTSSVPAPREMSPGPAPRPMTGGIPPAPRFSGGAGPGAGQRVAPQARPQVHPQGGRGPAPAVGHRGQGGGQGQHHR
jgi:hypothetical protein